MGNCHIYIDEDADVQKALNIIINAKTDRPAVCNAAETLLIHEKWFKKYHEVLFDTLEQHSVTVHGDEEVLNHRQMPFRQENPIGPMNTLVLTLP